MGKLFKFLFLVALVAALAGGGSYVEGGHDTAEPSGGGDGLKSGDAGADDEDFRW